MVGISKRSNPIAAWAVEVSWNTGNRRYKRKPQIKKEGDSLLNNTLFVTAGEIAEELGISKPFAYKLVRQMNEELEAKGFLTIAGRVSRKYYE